MAAFVGLFPNISGNSKENGIQSFGISRAGELLWTSSRDEVWKTEICYYIES